MRIWQCVKKLVAEIIYLIVNVMYLILLNQLNKELRLQNLNALKLLMYDGYIALKFFGVAILLFGIGCYLLRRRIKIIKTDRALIGRSPSIYNCNFNIDRIADPFDHIYK